ncbi:MAG: leucine-rich repeat domain-containing protein [Saprospiraceae bacterium]|nr:leucine-rich repeat domain-containing protein [Saprospiraceae bacterium]
MDREERAAAARRIRRLSLLAVLLLAIVAGAVSFAAWALRQRDEAVKQNAIVEQARAETQTALNHAEKLINAFYFYDDKFALAYDEKGEDWRLLFYFIDKNGEPVEKLGQWIQAEQFDDRGYAKVKKEEKDGRLVNYLLDTLGQTYRVAYNIKDIGPEIRALDLSEQELAKIPEAVYSNIGLEILLLNNNKLSSLPPEIGQLDKLGKLDLSDNPIPEAEREKIRKLLPGVEIWF